MLIYTKYIHILICKPLYVLIKILFLFEGELQVVIFLEDMATADFPSCKGELNFPSELPLSIKRSV